MTFSQNKKVSVVVPNYNYGRYLRKRIRSILRQTYPIYELIVLDDCSTDGSMEIIEAEIKKAKEEHPDLKIRFSRNKKNSGKAIRQWRRGIELAEGDYVWIAEADDLCSRRFLKEVMKGFDNSGVVLSYTESAIMNGFGIMICPNFRWSRDKEKTGHYKTSYVKDGVSEIQEIMAIRCTIPNVSAAVFRKDEKCLEYLDEALRFSQAGDWYFYAKVMESGRISYSRKSLNRFRVHGGSKTAGAKTDEVHYREILEMHEMFRRKYDLSEAVKERMLDEEKRIGRRMGLEKNKKG